MPLGRRGFLGGLFGLGALPFIGREAKAAPKREPQADDALFQPKATWPEAPPRLAPMPSSLGHEAFSNTAPSTILLGPGADVNMPFYVTRVNGYMVPVCQFNERGQVQFGPISFNDMDVKELRTGPYDNPVTKLYSSIFYQKDDPTRCIEHTVASEEGIYYMWSRRFRRWMKVTTELFTGAGDYDEQLSCSEKR